jgi:rSAM/selenodomain-associated transferase 2
VPHVKIAVVIPALDEADHIAGAISSARGFDKHPGAEPGAGSGPEAGPGAEPRIGSGPSARGSFPGGAADPLGDRCELEILVVDGGSCDGTRGIALGAGARVIQGDRGRARQLELGWRSTAGEAVLFLHADTRLEPGWVDAVTRALRDPSVSGGAFRLRFEGEGASLRLLELGVRVRVKLLGLPYGDQAIFVRRSILEEMGGIPSEELMEDLDLVAAIKARGRLALLSHHAITSPRRYIEHGALRTVARHLLALAAWRLGVDRRRVAGWVHR